MLKTLPAVFAVGKDYHIMVPVTCETLMYVRVGDECFYDESNGIMRSDVIVHKAVVPAELLDKERKYTVCIRRVIERKPYYTETEDIVEFDVDFYPVKNGIVRAYHISDTHNSVEAPVAAAKEFGPIDFLILNGDIPNHSGNVENIITLYEIAAKITGGNIPVVFARGNHDMRGVCAEKFSEITPCDNGNSYYTFRLNHIWGLILDCGEDKDDGHEAYGNTICCHAFRKRQTHFIENIIENSKTEYDAQGVEYKLVICHVPFTRVYEAPFDIEKETYSKWAKLLKENIKPDVMICGHKHKKSVDEVGCELDGLGQPCTVVVASEPISTGNTGFMDKFTGAGICFENGKISVCFTSDDGKTKEEYVVKH